MGDKKEKHKSPSKMSRLTKRAEERKNIVAETLPQSHTVGQKLLLLAEGAAILFLLGCGVTSMTSGHVYLADGFFLAATILFLWRCPWPELSRKQGFIAVVACVFIVCIGISGNHYLNYYSSNSKTKSVAKQKIPPTTAELEEHLREQLHFLRWSCQYFDQGREIEAKRIASALHILFVDTEESPSLLSQMRLRDEIQFRNTGYDEAPGNLLTYTGLVGLHFSKGQWSYVPMFQTFSEGIPQGRIVPFETWWHMIIIDDHKGMAFTRESLVKAVAEQDGGVEVASGLDPAYVELARKKGGGWQTGGKTIPAIELHSIREIAWEVMDAINRQYPQYLKEEGAM